MDDPRTQFPSLARSLVGQRIGSYRVVETLGSGGMSTVFLAVHADTGHEVALKVMQGTLARNSTLLHRFLREARSAESLEHPNIVAIYDRGVDQGRHYLALEYVPGGDFHDYIQRKGPLGADEAIAVIRGVASALRHAAGRGVIHRDIKPSNILRSPDGSPKIIDLGLALQAGAEDERVTREGTTVGTVDYMSPEQARDSRATSVQSDMYSLGCTFYYMLAGVPPFPGGDITDKLTRHARTPVPDIRDLRPDIPPPVARIILKMMAKLPEERFDGYDELIAALDAVPLLDAVGSPGVALEPLADDVDVEWPRPSPP
ncbi:MAG: serine/threonine-protein kinase, partial [Isosphaeraceae bacterium]